MGNAARTWRRIFERWWPSNDGLTALFAVAVLAGGLAFGGFREARRRRADADATLHAFAHFASDLYLTNVTARAQWAGAVVLYPTSEEQLDSLHRVAALPVISKVGRRVPCYDGSFKRYRLIKDGRFITNVPADTAQNREVRQILQYALGHPSPPRDYGMSTLGAGSTDAALAWVYDAGSAAESRSIIGAALCDASFRYLALEQVFQTQVLLPPDLVGSAPQRIAYGVQVAAQGGRLVFDGALRERMWLKVTRPYAFGGAGDSLFVTTAISEAGARALLPGHVLPGSGWQFLVLGVAAVGLLMIGVYLVARTAMIGRERGRFLAAVSHELRTPLSNIVLFADLLQHRSDALDQPRALGIIRDEAGRLHRMVENVLSYARLTDSTHLHEDLIDLDELSTDLLASLEPLVASRAATIEWRREGNAQVFVSRDGIWQILTNLIDNAIKYGPDGQTVHIALAAGDERLTLVVEDDGPGIPHRLRALALEPFVRGDVAEARTGGSGLGLAIVRNLAEAMHGTVKIDETARGSARIVVSVACKVSSPAPGAL